MKCPTCFMTDDEVRKCWAMMRERYDIYRCIECEGRAVMDEMEEADAKDMADLLKRLSEPVEETDS